MINRHITIALILSVPTVYAKCKAATMWIDNPSPRDIVASSEGTSQAGALFSAIAKTTTFARDRFPDLTLTGSDISFKCNEDIKVRLDINGAAQVQTLKMPDNKLKARYNNKAGIAWPYLIESAMISAHVDRTKLEDMIAAFQATFDGPGRYARAPTDTQDVIGAIKVGGFQFTVIGIDGKYYGVQYVQGTLVNVYDPARADTVGIDLSGEALGKVMGVWAGHR